MVGTEKPVAIIMQYAASCCQPSPVFCLKKAFAPPSKRGNIKIIATKATHPTLIPEQSFFISFFIAYTSKNPFSRKTDTASVLRKSAIRCNEKQLIIILYNAPALPVFTPIKIPRSLLAAGDGFAVRAFG
jgi:hypothetical protein